MGGKHRDEDAVAYFLREVSPPPGVEVQVYRRRQDDPNKWEYLGWRELEFETELDFVQAVMDVGLYDLCPHLETQRQWGGGRYQFRFRWRDEEGRKKRKGTKNRVIDGDPIPRR